MGGKKNVVKVKNIKFFTIKHEEDHNKTLFVKIRRFLIYFPKNPHKLNFLNIQLPLISNIQPKKIEN